MRSNGTNLVGGFLHPMLRGGFVCLTYMTCNLPLCPHEFIYRTSKVFTSEIQKIWHTLFIVSQDRTILNEFFTYNAAHPSEPKYCFFEFAEHHVWHSQSKTWRKIKRSKVIRRLAFVAPLEGKRYRQRLLIAHIVGPCSFRDLLIVNNQVCATYHEAALKWGFVEPDDLIEQCLDEAIEVQMLHVLRRLFATLLIFFEPIASMQRQNRYYIHLSEDFALQHQNEPHETLLLIARAV